MRTILKVAIFPALLLALASTAYADSAMLNSSGCSKLPCTNGALQFTGTSPLVESASGVLTAPGSPTIGLANATGFVTYSITPNPGWMTAINGSNWVFNQSDAGSNSPNPAIQNAFYYYQTTFTLAGGVYNGALGVMADDTAEVLLSGPGGFSDLLQGFASNSSNGPCAQGGGGPTCTYVYNIPIDDLGLSAGTYKLTIIDAQTNGWAAGVDLSGSVATPEPSSLLLLGTGLLGLAFVLFRKNKPASLVLHS